MLVYLKAFLEFPIIPFFILSIFYESINFANMMNVVKVLSMVWVKTIATKTFLGKAYCFGNLEPNETPPHNSIV